MSLNQRTPRKDTGTTNNPLISFDVAFIGGSLAVGAMLFVILLTIKGLFPPMH